MVGAGQCLDLTSSSAGQGLIAATCNSSLPGQSFVITPESDGFYTLTSSIDGLCLDYGTGSEVGGLQVVQNICSPGSFSQLWGIDQNSDGSYLIKTEDGTGCLSASSSSASGGAVSTMSCTSSSEQIFQITSFTAQPLPASIQPYNAPNGFDALSTINQIKGRPARYNATLPTANWNLAPQGQPGDFGAITYSTPSPGVQQWSETNGWASADFTLNQGAYVVTLHQDGTQATCVDPTSGTPAEHDYFIQPDSNAINSNFYASTLNFPTLGQLSSFMVSGQVTMTQLSRPDATSSCTANHASINYGVTLTDNAVTPVQMFWYAIKLGSVCEPATAAADDPQYLNCMSSLRNPVSVEYWTGAEPPSAHVTGSIINFAVSDLSGPILSAPGTLNLSVDLLPRISGYITAGQYGIDTDLSHWKIDGVNMGQELWGDVLLETTWQGGLFTPTWTFK